MTNPQDGSITRLIGDLAGGDADEAARRLWDRYFNQLVRVAGARLRAGPRGPADEEDAALSAFNSLCRGMAAGRFPALGGRDELWRLLVTITARKAADYLEREGRLKRGGGRVVSEADLNRADCYGEVGGIARIVGPEPTPDFLTQMDEEIRGLFARLPDETLRVVALMKLEGYTNPEIAARLDCALRSVERKLERIRLLWTTEGAS